MTQAEITRHVKSALKAARDMGLNVTSYKITFAQGVPCVEVTTGPESSLPAPVQSGSDHVQELKTRVERLHVRRT